MTETVQELYTRILKGLWKQGMPSGSPSEGCLYRSPNGHKCAVGMIISDDKYDTMLEGQSVAALFKQWSHVFPPGLTKSHMNMLKVVQLRHDSNVKDYGIRKWKGDYDYFRECFTLDDLTFPTEEELNA